jgi:hypothetical protein
MQLRTKVLSVFAGIGLMMGVGMSQAFAADTLTTSTGLATTTKKSSTDLGYGGLAVLTTGATIKYLRKAI